MTLNTHIVVKDPTDPAELFKFCQSLLGDPDRQAWEHAEGGTKWDSVPHYCNHPDQGLDGWLFLHYATDGPLGSSMVGADFDTPEEHEEFESHWRGCIHISIDTAYSYQEANGAGCHDLHAWFITQVSEWLEHRDLDYEWQNEFTGEWYDSWLHVHELGDPQRGTPWRARSKV